MHLNFYHNQINYGQKLTKHWQNNLNTEQKTEKTKTNKKKKTFKTGFKKSSTSGSPFKNEF